MAATRDGAGWSAAFRRVKDIVVKASNIWKARLPGILAWLLLVCGVLLCAGPALAGPVPYFKNLDGNLVDEIVLGPAPENQGILLIVLDTLRPDFLGAYGSERPTSPFIDSLAADGVLFANHFSNSTWTKPSVASILTGLYPQRHGVLPVTAKLAWNIPTVAEVFKQAGFRTGAVVGNKFAGRRYRLHKGFDRYIDPSTHFKGPFPTAEELLRIARRWIELDKDRPFFYVIMLVDPHDPYDPNPYYREKFCSTCQAPEVSAPQREYHGRGPTRKQIEDMKSLYAGEIRYVDDQLSVFFDALDRMGLGERLTTVLMGDHGEAFGEHGVFEHAYHCWDEVTRTPLIIHSPRVTERGIYTGMTQHVDVFPTLLKLAGIEPIEGLQGRSLVQGPDDAPLPRDRLVVTEVEMYGIHRTILRDSRFKLIQHDPLDETEFLQYYHDVRIYPSVSLGTGRKELYDVIADPYERENIYDPDTDLVVAFERTLARYFRTGDIEDESLSGTPSDEVIEDLRSLGYLQ